MCASATGSELSNVGRGISVLRVGDLEHHAHATATASADEAQSGRYSSSCLTKLVQRLAKPDLWIMRSDALEKLLTEDPEVAAL